MKGLSIFAALAVFGITIAAPTPGPDSVDEGVSFGISNNGPIVVRDDVSGVDGVVDEHEAAVDTVKDGLDLRSISTNKHIASRGNLPGLDPSQSRNAWAIMQEVKKSGTGWQGCMVAITTALTESNIRILANHAVPASLQFPNEGVGADYDSVGIYQQRAQWYNDISCSMRADCSTRAFIIRMKTVGNWQGTDVAVVCQAVQISEKPTAYQKWVGLAVQICKAGF
ncbi:hypothetical protein JDV02_000414 [Purpureocillium takamizusanense]|uniref:Uncharacterized protein n=1 Tax=Purpureocillium takamizusanense TaxID=2060973 RepID=A0A9Q8Q7B8_9HYPO|nr:uncharacterized protein JDV02_000414 [Purpureocillium takamizusanense]UNI13693.1 hypothetical protein JDV02_000414 [Purpureocillium takamizusanense]